MKRVVFTLPALCAGGAERVVVTLMNNLDKSKFEPHMVALQDGPVRDWIAKDIPVHILNKNRASRAAPAFFSKLKEIKPDVVMSSIVQMNMLTVACKPFFPKTKFIIRESSLPSAMTSGYGWKSKVCVCVYKYLYPHADLVICPSQQILNEFKDDLGLRFKREQVLYNPVDIETIRAKIGKNFAGTAEAVKFITVGRLTFEKAYDILIEYLGKLDMPYAWTLDILGEGEEREKLETLIKKHDLGDKVFLRGHQDNPWDLMARADAFLLTSLWEGMPNAALESLVCGTPVIGITTAGGINEIARHASDGAVKLSDTMEGVIELMSHVTPHGKEEAHLSALPESFILDNVCEKFEGLLKSL